MLHWILITALLLAAPTTSWAKAQSAGAPAAASPAWQRMIERDKRVSFTTGALGGAIAALSRPDLIAPDRAAALFALGASKSHSERSRLESWALEGGSIERAAAILALGELGGRDISFLLGLARSLPPELAEYPLLAMLRSGSPDGEVAVELFAKQPSSPLGKAAAELLQFHRAPTESASTRAAQRLLELRWEAARRYGLIDQQTWSSKVLDELLDDDAFLDRVILRAAAELSSAMTRDHYLGILLEPGDPVRVRAVVDAIPAEVDQLVLTGLWVPADEVEWTELVTAIDEKRLESLTANVLRQARVIASLRTYASMLLVRGGNAEGFPLLELELNSNDHAVRARILEVIGIANRKEIANRMPQLVLDPDPRVRTAAWVAQLMWGMPQAREKIGERLAKPDDDHRVLIESLCRNARHPLVRTLLVDKFRSLDAGDQVRAACALAITGRTTENAIVREVAKDVAVTGELGIRIVRALGVQPTTADLSVLRGLFPREGEFEVDVELAIALIRAKDPVIRPLLRRALWREPWHRSLLAAQLVCAVQGVAALREELSDPPIDATTRDVRRVGFALGENGGLQEVEDLARRTIASDPALQGALLGALAGRTR